MALKFSQKYKKQKYLLGALLLIIAVTAFIWWKGFYSPSGGGRDFSSSFKGRNISINFEILELGIFEEMRPFVKISMPEKIGKKNPFLELPSTEENVPVEEEE
jgi:hypothetical protein